MDTWFLAYNQNSSITYGRNCDLTIMPQRKFKTYIIDTKITGPNPGNNGSGYHGLLEFLVKARNLKLFLFILMFYPTGYINCLEVEDCQKFQKMMTGIELVTI